jgi:hypothetical protein
MIFEEYHFSPIIGFNSENGELNDKLCLNGVGCLLITKDYVKRKFFNSKEKVVDDLVSYPIRVTSFEPKQAICFEKKKRFNLAEKSFLQEAASYFRRSS